MIDFQFVNVPHLKLFYVDDWFVQVCENEGKSLSSLSLIFGSDDWLLEYNQKYLNHDFLTDIISFDYCVDNIISGDLLISLDRVNENANIYNVSRETELNRVMVHGLLHLIGYGDKTEADKIIMRKKENLYLNLLED